SLSDGRVRRRHHPGRQGGTRFGDFIRPGDEATHVGIVHIGAVYLLQPDGFGRQCRSQPLTVDADRPHIVSDMIAQIECVKWRTTGAPGRRPPFAAPCVNGPARSHAQRRKIPDTLPGTPRYYRQTFPVQDSHWITSNAWTKSGGMGAANDRRLSVPGSSKARARACSIWRLIPPISLPP